MTNYREIVTKSVIGKGKKTFSTTKEKKLDIIPSTILGCWVINHQFQGSKLNDRVTITGSYDVNIWYSYDNDTKTDVIREHDSYQEIVNVKNDKEITNEEIIIRSLKQPTCIKIDINSNSIIYTIEKELGIELVGDEKVKIAIDETEDSWDEILEDLADDGVMNKSNENKIEEQIENVKEDFLEERQQINE